MNSLTFVMAQENLNVGVVAGDTTVSDMITSDTQPSSVLGGIVSAISSEYERYVNFGAVKVWKDSTNENVQDFTLIMFPTGTTLGTITNCNLFKTSENVEIRGVNGIWSTDKCQSVVGVNGADKQDAVLIQEQMNFTDGTWSKVTFDDGTGAVKFMTNAGEVIGIWGNCSSITLAEAQTEYPTLGITAIACSNNIVVLVSGVNHYINDKNKDGDFVFGSQTIVDGYQVSSHEGQALAIIPTNNYDVYGII
jgi:hypothetical protein